MSPRLLRISDDVILSPLEFIDAEPMTELLQDPSICSQLASIDLPYSIENARRWINKCRDFDQEFGRPTQWAIRFQGQFAGEIGFHSFKPIHQTQAAIGFWVGRPFQRKGLATQAIQTALNLGFTTYGFKLIRAAVFAENTPSLHVLKRCGFSEPVLQRAYLVKNGAPVDCWLLEKTLNPKI